MRILILEPGLSGHHSAYLRWLLEATSRRGWPTVLATIEAAGEQSALHHVLAGFSHVQVHWIKEQYPSKLTPRGPWKLVARDLHYRRMFRFAARNASNQRIDAVLLPYLDYCFYSISVFGAPFGPIPWCGISMRLSVPQGASDDKSWMPLKWRFAKRILNDEYLRALFVINPSLVKLPASWCPPERRRKLVYLPDPARVEGSGDRERFRANLGISPHTLVILVLGAIDSRKGADELISCLAADTTLNAYGVLIAGRVADDMRNYLHSPAPLALKAHRRLFVIDRFLEDEELTRCLRGADAVWLGYREHPYMSGVLVLAGMAGLPVIGTNRGEIGQCIDSYKMGVGVDVQRTADLAAALRRLLDAETRQHMGSQGRKAFAGHTVENFGELVLDAFAKH